MSTDAVTEFNQVLDDITELLDDDYPRLDTPCPGKSAPDCLAGLFARLPAGRQGSERAKKMHAKLNFNSSFFQIVSPACLLARLPAGRQGSERAQKNAR